MSDTKATTDEPRIECEQHHACLADLLHDLAEPKRMSVNSCLEEILLHTCEIFGDGVASPHTKRTIEYIQQLKQKHGIDYDTHASYRFVEG